MISSVVPLRTWSLRTSETKGRSMRAIVKGVVILG
jgi:hypothetical protein